MDMLCAGHRDALGSHTARQTFSVRAGCTKEQARMFGDPWLARTCLVLCLCPLARRRTALHCATVGAASTSNTGSAGSPVPGVQRWCAAAAPHWHAPQPRCGSATCRERHTHSAIQCHTATSEPAGALHLPLQFQIDCASQAARVETLSAPKQGCMPGRPHSLQHTRNRAMPR